MRLRWCIAAGLAVLAPLFGVGADVAAGDHVAALGALQDPRPGCATVAEKAAAPRVVVLGDAVTVTLHFEARCADDPPPLEIVLAMDRSTSMLGAPISAAKDAALAFIDLVDLDRHRVGVVSFAELATVDARPTRDRNRLAGAIRALEADGSTDVAAGLRTSGRVLPGAEGHVVPVIVLVSDGFDRNGDEAVRQAADIQKSAGIIIATVALEFGARVALLRDVATAPGFAYVAPRSRHLLAVLEQVALDLEDAHVSDVRITDRLPEDMRFEPGSAMPPTRPRAGVLTWSAPLLPTQGLTMSYRLVPLALGEQPTNVTATARYIGAGGQPGVATFPVPVVDVVEELPTATPRPRPSSTVATPTAVPSATATTAAVRRFLPVALAGACSPTGWPADVIVVLDASTTMLEPTRAGRTKIAAAAGGVARMADPLTGRGKRLGLVVFHRAARLAVPLTADPSAVTRGLAGIAVASGSRIDSGLLVASDALRSGGRQGTRKHVVLVSDGRPVGASHAQVQAAAERLASSGARVSVVAMGLDADRGFLATLAGPGDLHDADDGEGFDAVVDTIVARLDCAGRGAP